MNFEKSMLRLYAVTDRTWLNGRTLETVVEEALQAGVTMVQLREKSLSKEELLQEALRLKEVCHRYHVPLLIDDDVEICALADADGVHVGQDDMEAGDVRAKLGPEKIIGVSAHTVEEALRAQERGADYLGAGAVFPTGSKADAGDMSHETLQAICEAVDIPVIAIGGITRSNVKKLSGRGLCGIAVISAIFGQPEIEKAAAELKQRTEEMVAVK